MFIVFVEMELKILDPHVSDDTLTSASCLYESFREDCRISILN